MTAQIEKATAEGRTSHAIAWKTKLAQELRKGALTADGLTVTEIGTGEPTTDELRAALAAAELEGDRQKIALVKLDLARRFAGR